MSTKKPHTTENEGQGEANPDEVVKQKTAFFITPLGSDDSIVRRNTNGIINAVIRPVLKKHDIFLIPPHEIDDPGNITKQIISQILTADLVIADLTGLNPNVMYELAVRHARRLPVIVICEHGTKLPFDIAAERTFFYYNDMAGTVQLTDQLDKTIPRALLDEKPDNPIYNGLEATIIQKITEESDDPVRSYIVEKLSTIDELTSLVKKYIIEEKENRNGLVTQSYAVPHGLSRTYFDITYYDKYPKEDLDPNKLDTGDVVWHPKFGYGTVLTNSASGESRTAIIHFDKVGAKQLLLDIAKNTLKYVRTKPKK